MYGTLHNQIAAPTESICSCECLAPALKVMRSQTAVEGLRSSVQAGAGEGEEGLLWQELLN